MFKPLDGDVFEGWIWFHLLKYLKHPIGEFHQELLRMIRHSRVAIAAPRSFAKSTYFTVFYPLFAALERPGCQILLVSASWQLATDFLGRIRKELDSSPTIKADYGDQSPKTQDVTGKWTNDELHLANGSVIRARGAGQQIRGMRPDIIVVDDLETDETVVSKERTQKLDNWLKADITGALRADGQLIFIGTILHPESVLNTYITNPPSPEWVTRLYRADGEDGFTPLWPDEWPLEKLLQRKQEIGEYLFSQEYRNDPIPANARKFRADQIQYFEEEPPNCVYFTAVDPAISQSTKADYTAIVTVAVDSDHNMYVVDVVNKRMLPAEVVDRIFSVYDRYKPASIGIEAQGFQYMLKHEIDLQKVRRNVYPIIVDLAHGGRRKEMRIEALQPRFEAKKVFIKRDQEELKTQLLRFPSLYGHDDVIDALAYILDIYRPANPQELRKVNPMSFEAQLHRAYELADQKAKQSDGGPRFWGNQNVYKEER